MRHLVHVLKNLKHVFEKCAEIRVNEKMCGSTCNVV